MMHRVHTGYTVHKERTFLNLVKVKTELFLNINEETLFFKCKNCICNFSQTKSKFLLLT